MKKRPILFSAPMVQALLAETKTQTRRIVKDTGFYAIDAAIHGAETAKRELAALATQCPHGQPGDRIWVRETCRADELPDGLDGVRYLADDVFRPIDNTPAAADLWFALYAYRGKRGAIVPSIHMPRWASRISLEITGVRVERLNDISGDDAMAEGVQPTRDGAFHIVDDTFRAPDPVECYARLWEDINGTGSWAANPWCWCIEFQRIK